MCVAQQSQWHIVLLPELGFLVLYKCILPEVFRPEPWPQVAPLYSVSFFSYTGFIRGILRGVRYAKSLRVLFLHRRSPSWTTLVLYSRAVFIFNEPNICIATQIPDCYWLEKVSSHSLVLTRGTRKRVTEKSSGQTHLFNIWTKRTIDRTSGQAEPIAQSFFTNSGWVQLLISFWRWEHSAAVRI
jgi:hypothetical protein